MKLIEPELILFWLGSESEQVADYYNIALLESGEVLFSCPVIEMEQDYE